MASFNVFCFALILALVSSKQILAQDIKVKSGTTPASAPEVESKSENSNAPAPEFEMKSESSEAPAPESESKSESSKAPAPESESKSESSTSGSSDLITTTCEKTLYKDLCKQTLEEIPDSKSADLQGLAKIALKLASTKAGDIHDLVEKLQSEKSTDPSLQQGLTDCSENYKDAIDQFEDSLAAIDSKDYKEINIWITAAMTDAGSCEEGLKGESTSDSPLTALNTKFSDLCSICLTITNLLDHQ